MEMEAVFGDVLCSLRKTYIAFTCPLVVHCDARAEIKDLSLRVLLFKQRYYGCWRKGEHCFGRLRNTWSQWAGLLMVLRQASVGSKGGWVNRVGTSFSVSLIKIDRCLSASSQIWSTRRLARLQSWTPLSHSSLIVAAVQLSLQGPKSQDLPSSTTSRVTTFQDSSTTHSNTPSALTLLNGHHTSPSHHYYHGSFDRSRVPLTFPPFTSLILPPSTPPLSSTIKAINHRSA